MLALITLLLLLFWASRLLLLTRSVYDLNMNVTVQLKALDPPRAGEHIVIFAPHPDDETLGTGGYIQQALAAGATVHVVLMTNGEYPELSVVLFEETLPIRAQAFINLGYMRQQETLAAMRYLGLPAQQVTFLGYPNQYLNQMLQPNHWLLTDPVRSARMKSTYSPYRNAFTPHTIFCGSAMLRDVETILRQEKPDVVITLHPHDLHVDHWPTYTVVRMALEELAAHGETFAANCRVFSYLIHWGAWPVPRRYRPLLPLDPPAALIAEGVTDWRALSLTLPQTLHKHQATAYYRTQGGAIDPLLQSFARSDELFGIQPTYPWPTTAMEPFTASIPDPPGELDNTILYPSADIINFSLRRQKDTLVVMITTRGPIAKQTGYHVLLHSGGADEAARVIAEYDWQGKKVTGQIVYGLTRAVVDPASMQLNSDGSSSILTVPWPFPTGAHTFALACAWTTRGHHPIDHTIDAVFSTQHAVAPVQ